VKVSGPEEPVCIKEVNVVIIEPLEATRCLIRFMDFDSDEN
jgi:hypothetical protein